MKSVVFVLLLCFAASSSFAQKLSKTDKLSFANLQAHTSYLAADKLEGRRTGTKGEELAYQYIIQEFKKNGIEPKGTNGYLQVFEVNEGRQLLPSTFFIIDGEHLKPEKDFFPFSWSANGNFEAMAAAGLHESGGPWLWDIKELLTENENNPHFDLVDAIRTKEKDAAQKGATALIIFNSGKKETGLKYDPKDRSASSAIPVIWLHKRVGDKIAADPSAMRDINLKVEQGDKIRKGHNVVG
ncbi:MAG: hypothetical protein GXC73_07690, partial [Chitinophagaceae bacterium]|nr:hypothetical protein [Chitinophagaceae bacterium]